MDRKAIARALLILPPLLFWFLWLFIESGPGENYLFLLFFLASHWLSVAGSIVCFYIAFKYRRNAVWWLLLAFELSPIIWTYFIFPFVYVRPE